jgi:hypothetical protein
MVACNRWASKLIIDIIQATTINAQQKSKEKNKGMTGTN